MECRLAKTASSVAVAARIAAVLVVVGGCQRSAPMPETISFDHVIVDQDGPISPRGKTVGDINGDGRPDLVVGGHAKVLCYENLSRMRPAHHGAVAGS